MVKWLVQLLPTGMIDNSVLAGGILTHPTLQVSLRKWVLRSCWGMGRKSDQVWHWWHSPYSVPTSSETTWVSRPYISDMSWVSLPIFHEVTNPKYSQCCTLSIHSSDKVNETFIIYFDHTIGDRYAIIWRILAYTEGIKTR